MDEKTLLNELYDAALYTTGAVIIGMVGKKVIKDSLGTPSGVVSTLKLSVAMAGGLVLTKFAQSKKWLPVDPFNGKK